MKLSTAETRLDCGLDVTNGAVFGKAVRWNLTFRLVFNAPVQPQVERAAADVRGLRGLPHGAQTDVGRQERAAPQLHRRGRRPDAVDQLQLGAVR